MRSAGAASCSCRARCAAASASASPRTAISASWQLERWFGVAHPERVACSCFAPPTRRAALMGAAGTNIAKPWRSEVYISETAGRTPCSARDGAHRRAAAGKRPAAHRRSAGRPVARPCADRRRRRRGSVARRKRGLTPHQWARAMLELGMLPTLQRAVRVGFLGQQKRLAYTLSGSLLRYIAEHARQRGAAPHLRGAATWRPRSASRFRARSRMARLSALAAMLSAALALAPLSASRGSSMLSSVCPHAKAELQARSCAAIWPPVTTLQCRAGLRARCSTIDPQRDPGTRAALVGVLARLGDMQRRSRAGARSARRAPPRPLPSSPARARRWPTKRFARGDLRQAAADLHASCSPSRTTTTRAHAPGEGAGAAAGSAQARARKLAVRAAGR